MKQLIKKRIRKLIPQRVVELCNHDLKQAINQSLEYARLSYSQEGEDVVLASLINKPHGYYIDVGAHHPMRLSNTYYYYKQGWNGINIDAAPGSMAMFQELRARDTNLEIAISDSESICDFYIFLEGALNTFNKELAEKYLRIGNKLKEIIKIPTKTLASVLQDYLPKDQKIDFMNVDVEKFDTQVLISNDWNRYRPKVIMIEDAQFDIRKLDESEVFCFLSHLNYRLVAQTKNTLFFLDEN